MFDDRFRQEKKIGHQFETSFNIKKKKIFITSRSLNWLLLRGWNVILTYNSFVLYRRHGFYIFLWDWDLYFFKDFFFNITKEDFLMIQVLKLVFIVVDLGRLNLIWILDVVVNARFCFSPKLLILARCPNKLQGMSVNFHKRPCIIMT